MQKKPLSITTERRPRKNKSHSLETAWTLFLISPNFAEFP